MNAMRQPMAALVVALAVAHLMMMARPAAGAVSCSRDVSPCVHACIDYITGSAPKPSASCCESVQRIHAAAPTTGERHTVCHCLKIAGAHIHNLKDELVGTLPAECSVELPYHLSMKENCNNTVLP